MEAIHEFFTATKLELKGYRLHRKGAKERRAQCYSEPCPPTRQQKSNEDQPGSPLVASDHASLRVPTSPQDELEPPPFLPNARDRTSLSQRWSDTQRLQRKYSDSIETLSQASLGGLQGPKTPIKRHTTDCGKDRQQVFGIETQREGASCTNTKENRDDGADVREDAQPTQLDTPAVIRLRKASQPHSNHLAVAIPKLDTLNKTQTPTMHQNVIRLNEKSLRSLAALCDPRLRLRLLSERTVMEQINRKAPPVVSAVTFTEIQACSAPAPNDTESPLSSVPATLAHHKNGRVRVVSRNNSYEIIWDKLDARGPSPRSAMVQAPDNVAADATGTDAFCAGGAMGNYKDIEPSEVLPPFNVNQILQCSTTTSFHSANESQETHEDTHIVHQDRPSNTVETDLEQSAGLSNGSRKTRYNRIGSAKKGKPTKDLEHGRTC